MRAVEGRIEGVAVRGIACRHTGGISQSRHFKREVPLNDYVEVFRQEGRRVPLAVEVKETQGKVRRTMSMPLRQGGERSA